VRRPIALASTSSRQALTLLLPASKIASTSIHVKKLRREVSNV
jgi:hypothetical protein